MPTWIETKNEIERRNKDYDGVRRNRIQKIEEITNRPLVIYATAFLERDKAAHAGAELGIDNNDPVAFDEVVATIEGDDLDILIHSPGGLAEAAESVVTLLRSRFKNIRFIVPHMAKSAATMICCAGNELLMDERSELGPIDPQMLIRKKDGVIIQAPAQSILKQFDKAIDSLSKDPEQIPAWLPLLEPLGPSLITECESANILSKKLVADWLQKYMFSGDPEAEKIANRAATYFAESSIHLSHGRRIGIEQIADLGLKVTDLRNYPELREAIWNLYHAISWTFHDTLAIKIIESCHETAYIRQLILQPITMPTLPKQQPNQQFPSSPSKGGNSQRRKRH